jgi:hypothetical protein
VTASKSAWRTEVDAVAKHFYETGVGPDQRHKIRAVRTGGTRKIITAKRVKDMNPSLWSASRIQTPRLGLKGPAVSITTPVYKGNRVFTALNWMQQKNAEARALQAMGREIITGVAEDMDWPLGEGWTTSDGWQILRYMGPLQFSSTKLRELVSVEEAEQYMEETYAATGVYYRVEEIEPADDMDELST